MIYAIVTIIAVFVIARFLISLDKDKKVLESQPLEIKFGRLIEILDEKLLDGNGGVTVLDLRSLNIYNDDKTQIIQFFYSSSNLNLTWRSKFSGKEITAQKNIPNGLDWNLTLQEQIADSFINQIEMKIKTYKRLDSISEDTNSQTIEEKAKFKINSLFYAFCFSAETAKIFLEENSMRKNVAEAIYLSILEKNKFLETAFKLFAKKVHGVEFGESSFNFYRYNNFRFFLDVRREIIEGNSTFFEILYNDLEDVKDDDGQEYAVAVEFIVYVMDMCPKAVFVVVYDAILDCYAIRQVYKDGTSAKITFLEDYEESGATEFLEEFITNQNL